MSEKYQCGYCGAEYGTPLARAKCELECDEKRKQELERQRQVRLEEEREARRMAVNVAGEKYVTLARKYYEDYGEIDIVGCNRGKRAGIIGNEFLDRLFFW